MLGVFKMFVLKLEKFACIRVVGGFLWANGATFMSFKMMMNYKSEVLFKLSYPFFLSEMCLLE